MIEPLPTTPAHVLDRLGYTAASITNYRLAVLLNADPVDAEELLVAELEEARLAA